jgi:hypothetical protein
LIIYQFLIEGRRHNPQVVVQLMGHSGYILHNQKTPQNFVEILTHHPHLSLHLSKQNTLLLSTANFMLAAIYQFSALQPSTHPDIQN